MYRTMALLVILISLANGEMSDILGTFRLPNGIDIEMYQGDSTFSGKIVNLNGYRELDIKNPQKESRNDPLMGKIIISGLRYDDKKQIWSGGELYFTDKGITVNLTIESVALDGLHAVGSKLIMRKKIIFQRVDKTS